MELVEGERILWQGRPSWRAQISFFIVWIPLALIPVTKPVYERYRALVASEYPHLLA